MSVEVETRKIGGSIGIIIPKDVVAKENIRVHEKIIVEFKKLPVVGDFFGLAAWKRSTEEIMRDVKRGWK